MQWGSAGLSLLPRGGAGLPAGHSRPAGVPILSTRFQEGFTDEVLRIHDRGVSRPGPVY